MFFSRQKTQYEMRISEWSSDECSSDRAEQAAAASRLDALAAELEASPRKGSVLWRALGRRPEAPKGVYLWGGVGRGKSMLMDLFFGCLTIQRKRRVLFHEFMLEVHARLAEERKKEAGDRSEEHTSELQSLMRISYAVF